MSQKVPLYRAVIKDAAGDFVEMHEYISLKYGGSLNRSTEAHLVVALKSEKVNTLTTAILLAELSIYRWDDPDDSSTERLVWWGKLTTLNYSLDKTKAEAMLVFTDRAGLLNNRYVADDYSVTPAVDASAILWDLISITQAKVSGATNVGDLGIIQGSAPVSKPREPEKDLQNRTILDVMVAFSSYQDGMDWEITPTPKNQSKGIFNTFFTGSGQLYHKGHTIETPLVYYVDDTGEQKYNNIKSISVNEDGETYANETIVLGATIEESQLSSQAENATQQLVYGLYEDRKSETSVSEQDTLDDKAAERLKVKGVVPFNVKLTLLPLQNPRFGSYDVGDIFTVKLKHYNFRNFEKQYRLYRFTVTVKAGKAEEIEFELNNV